MNQSIGERLRARFYEGGLVPPSGVSEEDLDEFERSHGIRLPTDMRSYFRVLNGTGPTWAEGDDLMLSLWALEKLELVPACTPIDDGSKWFIFGDHCLSSTDYAIRLTADGSGPNPVCATDGKRELARSFTDFVGMYLAGRWIDLL